MAKTWGEKKTGRKLDQLERIDYRLQNLDNSLVQGGAKGRKAQKLGRKYARLYGRAEDRGVDPTEYRDIGTYDPMTGQYSGYTPPPPPPGPDGEPAPDPNAPPSVEDVTEDPFGPSNPLAGLDVEGLPPGINLNNEQGVRALEAMFPLVKMNYDAKMQQEAIGTAAKSIDDYKDDPTLQALASAMTARMENPFTFDDQTKSLMQSQQADLLANQEAAMGERLRAMGATQGISTDSPLYASMAQQAAMQRDVNQAQMDRKFAVDMALQDRADENQSFGMGSQFAGAYQAGLGQRMAGLQNQQAGARLTDVGNPFEGMWGDMLMADALKSSPSWASQYGGMAAGGMNMLGSMPWGQMFGGGGAAAGAQAGGAGQSFGPGTTNFTNGGASSLWV